MKTLKILFVIMLTSTVSSAGFAQQPNPNKVPPINKEAKQDPMNLSVEQKASIKKLHLAFQKEAMPIKNQIAEKKAHLKTLTTADKADMTAINATIDEIGAMKIQLEKKRVAMDQEIRKLLADDQRLIFDLKKSKAHKPGQAKKIKKMQKLEGRPFIDSKPEIIDEKTFK
jgi:Spy/CpxP family protein refolding chaperone